MNILNQVWHQFLRHRCFSAAGSLAYTTLLSVVPIALVSFASFSAISGFDAMAQQLEQFIFDNFVPSTGESVRGYVNQAITQVGKLSYWSLLFLVFTASLLIHSVDDVMNHIWDVEENRKLFSRVLLFILVIVLGPVLMGLGLGLTMYLLTLPLLVKAVTEIGVYTHYLKLLPFLFSLFSFSVVYGLVPNTRTSLKHIFIGAFVAACLFELAKHAFTWYVVNFSAYELLYGSLAVIPIFLVWVYISWVIVLLGAEVSSCLNKQQHRW